MISRHESIINLESLGSLLTQTLDVYLLMVNYG